MIKQTIKVLWDCRCDQCGHTWTTRDDRVPKNCTHPKCRSLRWNEDNPAAEAEQGLYSSVEDRQAKLEGLRELMAGVEQGPKESAPDPWTCLGLKYDARRGESRCMQQHFKTKALRTCPEHTEIVDHSA